MNDVAVDPATQAVYSGGVAKDGFSGILGGLWSLLFGSSTNNDGYLAKHTVDGGLVWQLMVGDANDDAITGVCTDPQGNVYITGWFTGQNASFTGVSGPDVRMSSAGGTDLFVACYSPGGVLQWKLRAGGTDDDKATGICWYDGKVIVAGAYRGMPALAGLPPNSGASTPANRNHGFILALAAGDGSGLWRVDGYNGEDSQFNAVTADASGVYAIGTHKGSYAIKAASGTATTLANQYGNRSADVVALDPGGSIRWCKEVANPGDDNINASGIATSADALYLTGSTHSGSSFPVNTVVLNTTHDHGYLARLNKNTGITNWVVKFMGGIDHRQVGMDLATDVAGNVYLTGNYSGTAAFSNGPSLSGASTAQVLVAKVSPGGTVLWAMSPAGSGPDQAGGVATGSGGRVYITGSYANAITFNSAWSNGSSRNTYLAALTDPAVATLAAQDPSLFRPIGQVCSNGGTVDLAAQLYPPTSGNGVAVIASFSVANPSGALGNDPTTVASFTNDSASLTIDMGGIIPAGINLMVRWRTTGSSSALNLKGAQAVSGPYTDLGNLATTSTGMVVNAVAVALPVRFVRLTRGSGETLELDGLYFHYASATSGTWAGTGVTGTSFNPAGLSGNVAITYTVQGHATTQVAMVTPMSQGGHVTGGGDVPMGASKTLALANAVGGTITWMVSTDNGTHWSAFPTDQDTYTLNNISTPTKVHARVASGTCPTANSDTIQVTPIATSPPLFTSCPGNLTAVSNGQLCGGIVTYAPPVAISGGGMIAAVVDQPGHQSGSTFPVGTTTVTYTATSTNGLSSTCSFTVTVADNTPPAISCPANIAVNAAPGTCGAVVTYAAPVGTDNCSGVATVRTAGPASGSTFPVGTTTVTYTATDAAGLSSSCSFTVNVADNTPPAISCPANIAVNAAPGTCGAVVTYAAPVGTDNCSGVATVRTAGPASGSTFPVGTTTVTYTATDAAGLSSSCSFTVTVADNTPPVALCQSATINLDGTGHALLTAVHVDAGSTDNCGVITRSVSPGSFNATGTFPATLTVVDASGNTSTCTATVTVVDSQAPTAVCHNATAYLDATGHASITAGDLDGGSSDNGTLVSRTADHTNFDCTNVGANTVILTVTDGGGNSSQCSATVTVLDTVHPVATCQPLTVQLDATGHAVITAAMINGNSSDNCGIGGISASRTTFDCSNTGVNQVALTVTDLSGNTRTRTAMVTVQDNLPPSITCPGNRTVTTNDGCMAATADLGTPVTADNCGVASVANDAPPLFPIGTSTIHWTVLDNSGHSASCPQTILVVDVEAPVAVCQPVTVALDGNATATITAMQVDGGSHDNCGITGMSLSTYQYHATGTYTDTLTVTDGAGNQSTCLALITITDGIPPTAICNNVTRYVDASGHASVTAADLDGGSTDNGAVANLWASRLHFTCADLGPNPDTLFVADNAGLTSFCIATVTVLDTLTPFTTGSTTATICPEAPPTDLTAFLSGVQPTGGTWHAPGGATTDAYFDPGQDSPGEYSYHAPSLAGCGTDIFRVTVQVPARPHAGSDTAVALCSSGSTLFLGTLLPGADSGGTWSNGSGNFNPGTANTGMVAYTVAGSDGCAADTAMVQVTVIQSANAGTSGTAALCADGGPTDLLGALGGTPASGGTWHTASGGAFGGIYDPALQEGGTYTYVVAGHAPCPSDSASVTVTETTPPPATWVPPPPVCASAGPIDLSAFVNGADAGTWTGAAVVNGHYFDPHLVPISGASGQSAVLHSVSANGCTGSMGGQITVWAMPQANAGADTSVCALEWPLMAAATFGEGTWSTAGPATVDGLHTAHALAAIPAPGSAVFTWSVQNGACTASDSIRITFHTPEELTLLNAGPDRTQDIGTTMALTGTAEGASWTWWSVATGTGTVEDPSAPQTTVSGLSTGLNILVLQGRSGNCALVSDTVALTVRGLLIPTGFSPNGDGVNDHYEVRGIEALSGTSLDVFDRWGNRVFHAAPYRNEWGGLGIDGKPLMDGTYFGILKIGGEDTWNGNITLKR